MTSLTFVAEPPPGVPEIDDDGNIAIQSIAQAIPDCERASSVRKLALRLMQLRERRGSTPLDVLQIIGHGRPGALSLGAYWLGNKSGDLSTGNVYVIDSSPQSYGVLKDWVDAGTEVRLLGCDVGAGTPAGGVAGGPTLLFALEQLWADKRVTVWAADTLVTSSDFTPGTGEFSGSLVRYNGERKVVGGSRPRNTQPFATAEQVGSLRIEVEVPAGPGSGGPVEGARTSSRFTVNTQSVRLASTPLALPLGDLNASLNGQAQPGQLLFFDRNYYVKIKGPGAASHFQLTNHTEGEQLLRSLREGASLLAPAL